MKKLYSCLIILTFLCSCTQETSLIDDTTTGSLQKPGDENPASNPNNPYDNVGRVYDELYDAYYDGSVLPVPTSSIITRVEMIANANSSFAAINTSGYTPLSQNRIQYFSNNAATIAAEVIASSSLSTTAKISLGNFMASFSGLAAEENDAGKLHAIVCGYEDMVLHNALLTANDRRLLLTTTSIARHSLYRARKKPKKNTDPDWIIFVAHIIATTEGAEESDPKAILLSLATGIASNT